MINLLYKNEIFDDDYTYIILKNMIKYENDIICVQLHGHSTCLLTSNYKKTKKTQGFNQ